VVEDVELRGRHIGVAHQFLGEHLARLDLGRRLRGPEDAQALFLKGIDDAVGQRRLGADDGQAYALLFGETDEHVGVVLVDRHVDAVGGGAGIAGRAKRLLDARRLRQLPHQGMLAPALADDQHTHGYFFSSLPASSTKV
jgi:hypothetical protein